MEFERLRDLLDSLENQNVSRHDLRRVAESGLNDEEALIQTRRATDHVERPWYLRVIAPVGRLWGAKWAMPTGN